MAAASRYSKEAFDWITEVENIASFEELGDSGNFPQLDTKLAAQLDKTLSGEFRNQIQVKEAECSKIGKKVTGRQITWMIY